MSEWISVQDRLPNDNLQEVLVFIPGHGVTFGQWVTHMKKSRSFQNGSGWFTPVGKYSMGVTHWMPFPDPPTA